MKISKLLLFFLPAILLVTGCKKDDSTNPVDPPVEKVCKFLGVDTRLDATTTFGIFSVDYDANNRIESAGLQTYDFTYDDDGKLTQALLEPTGFSPRVEFAYTYNGNQLTTITNTWGEEPNQEVRYIYDVNYDANGFVSSMDITSNLTLDGVALYTFDSNGNPTSWEDPVFEDTSTYAFDTSQKGLFENLDHTLAFAYGVALGQPFFHFRNAVTEEHTEDSDSFFTEATFNENGFQTTAKDPSADGKEYIFEHECL